MLSVLIDSIFLSCSALLYSHPDTKVMVGIPKKATSPSVFLPERVITIDALL